MLWRSSLLKVLTDGFLNRRYRCSDREERFYDWWILRRASASRQEATGLRLVEIISRISIRISCPRLSG